MIVKHSYFFAKTHKLKTLTFKVSKMFKFFARVIRKLKALRNKEKPFFKTRKNGQSVITIYRMASHKNVKQLFILFCNNVGPILNWF